MQKISGLTSFVTSNVVSVLEPMSIVSENRNSKVQKHPFFSFNRAKRSDKGRD